MRLRTKVKNDTDNKNEPDLDSSTEEKQIIEANKDEVEEENDSEDLVEEKEANTDGEEYHSDSDAAPEGISSKQSKKDAQDLLNKQTKAESLVKQKLKLLRKEREERNKLQQKKKERTSLVPEKLDTDILDLVDEDVDIDEDIAILPPQKQNNKIIFSDDENDENETDEEDIVENKIEASCLTNVHKPVTKDVKDFLTDHFYGDRIKREDFRSGRKRKQQNTCKVGWLKKRNSNS